MAFWTKLKRGFGYAGSIIFWVFVVWVVVGSLIGWIFGIRDREIRAGDPCGPGHRWTYVGIDPDLSCEPE
jgi:hypothetical protein